MANIVDVLVPKVGESVTEILEVRIIKNVGAFVEENGVILEGDSDKASVEVVSPISGFVKELLVKEGADFPIGEVIARIEEGVAPVSEVKVEEKSVSVAAKASTSVKEEKVVAATPVPVIPVSVIPQPVQTEPAGGERRVKMSPLRRTIARRLVEAQQNAAILTTFNEADMTGIKELRKKYQDRFVGRHGTKLGFMSFFVKAVIEGLKEYPAVNAEIDGNYIVYKDYYNISIAVSGPKGLMVPVVRNVDQMSFSEVELEIKRLAGLARDNKLKPDDFKGGTFTISNGGVFGSLMSTPILNRPQVGILGMHTIQDRPVAVNGKVEIRPMMYLALSYDHRIIDGSEAVSFLVRVKELVENPERILFDV